MRTIFLLIILAINLKFFIWFTKKTNFGRKWKSEKHFEIRTEYWNRKVNLLTDVLLQLPTAVWQYGEFRHNLKLVLYMKNQSLTKNLGFLDPPHRQATKRYASV